MNYDQLFELACEAAIARIAQRMRASMDESQRSFEVDRHCANETVICWGRPSRADQERIGGRYLAKVAEAGQRHSTRTAQAQSVHDQARRQIYLIRQTYESAADKSAVVQFAVDQLRAL